MAVRFWQIISMKKKEKVLCNFESLRLDKQENRDALIKKNKKQEVSF